MQQQIFLFGDKFRPLYVYFSLYSPCNHLALEYFTILAALSSFEMFAAADLPRILVKLNLKT